MEELRLLDKRVEHFVLLQLLRDTESDAKRSLAIGCDECVADSRISPLDGHIRINIVRTQSVNIVVPIIIITAYTPNIGTAEAKIGTCKDCIGR